MAETLDGDLSKLEERFLTDLEQRPVPIDKLLDTLQELRTSGQQELSEDWAQAMQEALVELGDTDALRRLLAVWAVWRADGRGFGAFCHDVLKKAGKTRLWTACIASVGFGEIAPSESLRRLDLLLSCSPGTFCLDKTWGFGVVKRVDDFYKRMVVDFTLKPNHAMALAYAAEALSLVGDDHLLARRHRDPAAIERLTRDDPGEVVRLVLRSFGPLSAARLETLLTEHKIVVPDDWKRFWDAARKALRSDPLVDIPAKRTEPLTLRSAAVTHDRAWFEALRGERDTAVLMRQLQSLDASADAGTLDAAAREALSDRLAFALKGAFNTDAALYARLALLTRRLQLTEPPAADLRAHLWDEERFVRAGESLPARDCGQMAAMLLEDEGAVERLLAAVPRMNLNLLSETFAALLALPAAREVLQARCRELLVGVAVSPVLLVWTLRNLPAVAGWPLPSLYELMAHAIAVIEDRTLSGETLRMQHHLHALFESAKWFEPAFESLSGIQRQAIFDRIYGNAPVWEPSAHRALVARMIKGDPDLAGRKRNTATVAAPAGRWTSWRSLRERQEQLTRLIEVDLPRNSQDIAAARSHGDLRENFEYQAAKQQQTILLQRREEWERDLHQVRGTGFAD
ncbi:MAG: hypothetical protein PHR35_10765, partial [Kiritimatiellae bacterium]|nr:hypothetical protein [Kiritimatiellia bacterium]